MERYKGAWVFEILEEISGKQHDQSCFIDNKSRCFDASHFDVRNKLIKKHLQRTRATSHQTTRAEGGCY